MIEPHFNPKKSISVILFSAAAFLMLLGMASYLTLPAAIGFIAIVLISIAINHYWSRISPNIPSTMLSKILKYTAITIGVLIGLLLFSNPSYSKFKQFANEIPLENQSIICKPISNRWIYSIYSKEIVYTESSRYSKEKYEKILYVETTMYYGILSNFYEFSRSKSIAQRGNKLGN